MLQAREGEEKSNRGEIVPAVIPDISHGEVGIRQVGRRAYVGGLWEKIGKLQFDFLIAQGLRPEHYLLDVGCGCLRGGVHFIAYLEPEHYLGLEKEPLLLEEGIRWELGEEQFRAKRPRLHYSEQFDVSAFGVPVHYALAQSVFTHLTAELVLACLRRIRLCMGQGGAFFATFFESPCPRDNPCLPHDHGYFAYTRNEMESFGQQAGWDAEYLGEWNHPRGQRMMCYRPSW